MDFISGSFLLFLFISLIVYYSVPKKGQWIWLLLVSTFFYLCATPKMAVFMFVSAISAFVWSKYFASNKVLFWCVILLNLGLLFGLKVASGGNMISHYFGFEIPGIILPLGISFYTMQLIAYMSDVKKGIIEAESNFLHFFLFITYFPHILQGPIHRYWQLMPQLIDSHKFDYAGFVGGFQLMIWGYFQKMVVADRAGILVDRIFGEFETYTGMYVVVACMLYGVQLYADFNGCFCIARGVSQMFGIDLADNFMHPFSSCSISEFWRRWHMSFGAWLRDYIYIPLGGNRKGKIRKYVNIWITFFFSGIWHGIGITFLVWGFLQGTYQVLGDLLMPVRDFFVQKLNVNRNTYSHKLYKQLVTYGLITFSWIFFRANSFSQSLYMMKSMVREFNPWILWDQSLYLLGLDAKNVWMLFFGIVAMFVVGKLQMKMKLREELMKQGIVFRYVILYLAIFAVLIFGIYGPGYDAAQFIYGGF